MKLLTTLAALLVSGSVAAQDKPAAAPGDTAVPPAVTATATPEPSSMFYDGNKWGLQLDVGAPAGASAALVYRPWSFLRVNAGVGYDVVAFGVKGGVTLIPFHWGVVPTLGLEAGHFFAGNLNNVVTFGQDEAALRELTKELGFDYVSADLGVEFGSQNRFVFYIRAGLAQVWGSVKNMDAALAAANKSPNTTYKATEPSAEARIPSARIGFILYLF